MGTMEAGRSRPLMALPLLLRRGGRKAGERAGDPICSGTEPSFEGGSFSAEVN